jgi:hypothetical protein
MKLISREPEKRIWARRALVQGVDARKAEALLQEAREHFQNIYGHISW